MFWGLFARDSPVQSALEGIVFKEGHGRFIKRFWKKRILAYDEVTKCLRYYTPQRLLKGTIYLHDILFITPGRSSGKDSEEYSVFEITVPGRVYVFHVNNVTETKKWIGIVSRELDNLQLRDRIQLNNGEYNEGTYSKTFRPNSATMTSLRIGDHREHEEGCFLFDEEQQHKVIALESLCSVQAMKIYELSHSVDKIQKKCEKLDRPPSEEMNSLQEENKKLRFSFSREQIRVMELKAKIEEAEEQKTKEQDKQLVQKVVKHQHVDFNNQLKELKVVHVERADSNSNSNSNSNSQKKIGSIASSASKSFVNLPSDKTRMEEIKRLTEELACTKALLADERARAVLDGPNQPVNFNSSKSPSPLPFDHKTSSSGSPTPPKSPTTPLRSAALNTSNQRLERLERIPESISINSKLSSSYNTFSPSLPSSSRVESPTTQLSSHPPGSPSLKRPQPIHPNPAIHKSASSPFNLSDDGAQKPSSDPHTPIEPIATHAVTQRTNAMRSSDGGLDQKLFTDFNINSFSPPNGKNPNLAVEGNALSRSATFQPAVIMTKPRSFSECGPEPPKNLNFSPKVVFELSTSPSRSRTSSNPPAFKSPNISFAKSADPLANKFGAEFIEQLASKISPNDDELRTQFISKLSEAVAEISNLAQQLRGERENVQSLMEEKSHMLDSMEDMKHQTTRSQKFRDEMEDLMEATEGKLNVMREALDLEVHRRVAAEAKLSQIIQAQANLQQSILEDTSLSRKTILQPLLANYSL